MTPEQAGELARAKDRAREKRGKTAKEIQSELMAEGFAARAAMEAAE